MKILLGNVENSVGKGENAHNVLKSFFLGVDESRYCVVNQTILNSNNPGRKGF